MRKQEERGIRRDGEVGGGIVDGGLKKVGEMKLLGFLVWVPRFSRGRCPGKYLSLHQTFERCISLITPILKE